MQINEVKLSIMYITRERKREIIRSIKTCIENKIKDMEIIVVDNASKDKTKEAVEKLLQEENISYQYVYSNINLGVSGGRNLAFSLCKGKYVLCLDDDSVIVTKKIFDKIYSKMEYNLDVVAAAIKIYEPETKKYLEGIKFENSHYKGMQMYSYIGAGHILRRNFFENKILYPEKLIFGSEELYSALLIHKNKKILAYFIDIEIIHIPSKMNRVVSDDRKLNILINTLVIRKYYYPKIMWTLLIIAFYLRVFNHKLYKFKKIKDINNIIRERFQSECMRPTTIKEFFCNIKKISLKKLL